MQACGITDNVVELMAGRVKRLPGHRLAELLTPWYEAIQEQALDSAVLNADETGWRVNGKTHWLWCFATETLSYFMIDRSRGSPALLKFFTEEFAGTLVSDFWGAYNALECALRKASDSVQASNAARDSHNECDVYKVD